MGIYYAQTLSEGPQNLIGKHIPPVALITLQEMRRDPYSLAHPHFNTFACLCVGWAGSATQCHLIGSMTPSTSSTSIELRHMVNLFRHTLPSLEHHGQPLHLPLTEIPTQAEVGL